MNIGILGIGLCLPKTKRTNEWWPENITQKWMADKDRSQVAALDIDLDSDAIPKEVRLLIEALKEYKDDPFDGSKVRYILEDDQNASDMEIQAAKEALENSGISPKKIDFILGQTTLSDKLNDSNMCLTQNALNIPNSCYAQDIVGMCNSPVSQLLLAQALIRSGEMRYGLLIQSSGMSRFLTQENPMSPLFGDGAAAMVVGPVPDGEGLLSIGNYTNGSFANYLMLGSPGQHWYDAKVTTYFINPAEAVRVVVTGFVQGKSIIEAALAKANLKKEDVDFFVGHQGSAWFRRVSQKFSGLEHAKFFDTFPIYSGIVGVNMPAILYNAHKNKLIKKNDILATYAPATGFVGYSSVIKWGL